MNNLDDLILRLQQREHYFLNASEGEYDANLLRAARFAIEDLRGSADKRPKGDRING